MALDFPASPTVGQKFNNFTWDGTRWAMFGSGGGDALIVTDWTNVTYENGWTTTAGQQAAQYRRVGDMVQLRFHMTSGSLGVNAFTLPVGFRPPAPFDHPLTRFSSPTHFIGNAYVQTNGGVNISGGGVGSYSGTIEFSTTASGGATVIGGTGPGPGIVAYAQITSNSTAFTTLTLISGLSVTWTARPSRRYKLSLQMEVIQSVAGDVWVFDLEDTVVGLQRITGCNQTTASMSVHAQHVTTTSISGTKTWRLNGYRASGTGNITVGASSTFPAHILVEDIGPL